jgi:hypothetical protein
VQDFEIFVGFHISSHGLKANLIRLLYLRNKLILPFTRVVICSLPNC